MNWLVSPTLPLSSNVLFLIHYFFSATESIKTFECKIKYSIKDWCNQIHSDYLYYIYRCFFLFVCCCYTLKMNFEFQSAVRGYHYYRKYWSPKEHETLNCYHEPGNPFDIFAIKTCSHRSLQPVGHLPREISRLTKLILDRGAEVEAKLTSNQYRSYRTRRTWHTVCSKHKNASYHSKQKLA